MEYTAITLPLSHPTPGACRSPLPNPHTGDELQGCNGGRLSSTVCVVAASGGQALQAVVLRGSPWLTITPVHACRSVCGLWLRVDGGGAVLVMLLASESCTCAGRCSPGALHALLSSPGRGQAACSCVEGDSAPCLSSGQLGSDSACCAAFSGDGQPPSQVAPHHICECWKDPAADAEQPTMCALPTHSAEQCTVPGSLSPCSHRAGPTSAIAAPVLPHTHRQGAHQTCTWRALAASPHLCVALPLPLPRTKVLQSCLQMGVGGGFGWPGGGVDWPPGRTSVCGVFQLRPSTHMVRSAQHPYQVLPHQRMHSIGVALGTWVEECV
jgi:hypothetical protein